MKPLPVFLVFATLLVASLFAWRTEQNGPPPRMPEFLSTPAPEAETEGLAKLGREAPPVVSFGEVPDTHRAEVVQARVQGFADTLQAKLPAAGVTMLEAECSSAPCLLGLDYDAAVGAEGFERAVRAAFEETMGYPVTALQVDEVEGRKRIWMFAVPETIGEDDPVRDRLIETGRHRLAILIGED